MLKKLRIKTPQFLMLFILLMLNFSLFSQTDGADGATFIISSKIMIEIQPSESNEKISEITVTMRATVRNVITGEVFEVVLIETADGKTVAKKLYTVGKFKSFAQIIDEMWRELKEREGKMGPRRGGDIILIVGPGSEKNSYPEVGDKDASKFVYKDIDNFKEKVLGDLDKFLNDMTIEK